MGDFIIPRTTNGNEIRKFFLKVANTLNLFVDSGVVGPDSVTDGRVAAFDGTTGQLLKQDTRLAANLVAGPSSATDNAIVRFDGTGGKTVQNTGVTIDDSNNLILAADIYTTDWTDYSSTAAWVGIDDWATAGWKTYYYKKVGDLVFIMFSFAGDMNAGSALVRASLPYAMHANWASYHPVFVFDSGAWKGGIAKLEYASSSTTIYFGVGTGIAVDNFDATANALKGALGSFFYRAAT
jgi:hypothetical protein